MKKKKKKVQKKPKQAPSSASGTRQNRQNAMPATSVRQETVRKKPSGSGGVPPLDAFERVERRPPPNLPGQPGFNPEASLPGHEPIPLPKREKQDHREGKKSGQTRENSNHQDSKKAATRQRRKKRPLRPAAQRKRRRRTAIISVLALIVIGTILSFTVFFKIDKFAVKGEVPYTEEEIITAFGYEKGENIFSFDRGKAEGAISKTLPYIDKVAIKRRLPGTILFEVTPAVEKYVAAVGGQYAVLSESRKVLRMTDEMPSGLIVLNGLDEAGVSAQLGLPLSFENENVALGLDSMIAELEARGMENITWVNVADPLNMQFSWQGRITVVIGSKVNIQSKMNFAFGVLTQTEQSKMTDSDRGKLDVSGYPANQEVLYVPE